VKTLATLKNFFHGILSLYSFDDVRPILMSQSNLFDPKTYEINLQDTTVPFGVQGIIMHQL